MADGAATSSELSRTPVDVSNADPRLKRVLRHSPLAVVLVVTEVERRKAEMRVKSGGADFQYVDDPGAGCAVGR